MANVPPLKFVHKSTGYEEKVRTTWSGQYDACLPLEGQWVVYIEREHFKPENYQLTATKGKTDFQEIRLRPVEGELATTVEEVMPLSNGVQAGSVLVMNKIFYEYNKATLNYGAVRHMDALFELMQRYPEMEIDLVVHTDTRGDARQNQELTDARARNAKTYLVYRGIDENRINAYGREKPNRATIVPAPWNAATNSMLKTTAWRSKFRNWVRCCRILNRKFIFIATTTRMV